MARTRHDQPLWWCDDDDDDEYYYDDKMYANDNEGYDDDTDINLI